MSKWTTDGDHVRYLRQRTTRDRVRVTFWPSAGAAPRADEEELGGAVQRAGGEETSVRGREGQLGGSAENPGAAETGRLQVSNAPPWEQLTH